MTLPQASFSSLLVKTENRDAKAGIISGQWIEQNELILLS